MEEKAPTKEKISAQLKPVFVTCAQTAFSI